MKKVTLWILVALVVAVCVQPAFAVYSFEKHGEIEQKNGRKAADAYMKKWDAVNKKGDILAKDVRKLADNIAAFNKPSFEAQLTKKEREYYEMGEPTVLISPVLWSRVWVKDKTLVFGMAKKDKKFRATYFATTDPEFVFLGGIRVGASTKTIEKFFGDSIANISDTYNGNTIVAVPQYDGTDDYVASVVLYCKNGLITQIIADLVDGFAFGEREPFEAYVYIYSKKAGNFAYRKLQQMGFSIYGSPFFDPKLK